MTRRLQYALGAFLLVGLGLGVVLSGALPLAASAGHWAITEWFLHFTMRRTVIARSAGLTAPPRLDEPALVLRGAGHFETGCRPCHGAPGSPQPVTLRNMTPRPPFLPERVPHWEPDELFWIVKHGIKFTGMPGWPVTEREDEIWSMVAFLRKLPMMSAEEYRWLARNEGRGDDERGASALSGLGGDRAGSTLSNCARCHGFDGLGRGEGAFPRLAGQTEAYLHLALQAYASGARRSGIMQPVAAELSEDTMQELARYYSSLPPGEPIPSTAEPTAVLRGEAIVEGRAADTKLPSCKDCHGPTTTPRKAAYPRLSGQYPDYIVLQLTLFKVGLRGGSPYAHLMEPVVERLAPQQMRDVAIYYSSLR